MYIISDVSHTVIPVFSLSSTPNMADLTGYGPSINPNLQFDGDDQKYEMWEVKFMSLMRIKKLHDVFTVAHPNADKNAQVFA